jgi:hypothetical protein
MKAVFYHADTDMSEIFPSFEARNNIYKNLTKGLKDNLKTFNLELIHLTVNGHEAWGDRTYFFDGDPNNIVYNREYFLLDFLKSQPNDEEFLVLEPDHRIIMPVPSLANGCDIALLRRNDSVAITPSWKLIKRSSIPFFEEVITYFNKTKLKWDGDSAAYIKMWENMGKPGLVNNNSIVSYNNLNIELRDYNHYSLQNSPIMRQWKSINKLKLL